MTLGSLLLSSLWPSLFPGDCTSLSFFTEQADRTTARNKFYTGKPFHTFLGQVALFSVVAWLPTVQSYAKYATGTRIATGLISERVNQMNFMGLPSDDCG